MEGSVMNKHKEMIGQAGVKEKNHVFWIFYLFEVLSVDLDVISSRYMED